MGTLADLCAQQGSSLGAAAVAIGVDPTLLLRVDQRRQALPISLVAPLAVVLGVERGTVEHAAQSVTMQNVPGVTGLHGAALTPYPARPELGDPV